MHAIVRRQAGILLLIVLAFLALPAVTLAQAQFARTPLEGDAVGSDPVLALAYQHSQTGQFDQVLALIRPLAESGNPQAQFVLGGLYSQGQGAPQDDELAAQWWRKAAEQGVARAQNEIGVALSDGRGVSADLPQAVVWYRKAADQGLAVAQANLGLMYWKGLGVRRDEKEAVVWYRRAAEQGFGWAEYYLGTAYATGRGLSANRVLAVEWFRKAAERGYTEARYALGTMYFRDGGGVNRDISRATFWLAQAAQQGHEAAAEDLKGVVSKLPRMRVQAATEIREKPDAQAAVIRTASDREYAHELGRVKDWVEVYFADGHTVGYISAARLRR